MGRLLSVISVFFLTLSPIGAFCQPPYVWSPSKMIIGEPYEGIVILKSPAMEGRLVLLSSSDPDIVEVPQSVTVLPESNHGIFKIKPLREGNATLLAGIDGKVLSTNVSVYSSPSKPSSLRLILPSNSTTVDRLYAYLFVVDSKGSPSPLASDTDVYLTPSGPIEAPSKITIKNQTYYSTFLITARGDGSITATSESLVPTTVDVKRSSEDVSVMIGVAPTLALPNSFVYYYVWLEKDGLPFKPPSSPDVYLSSSNSTVARFTPSGQGLSWAPMQEGIARGVLFTGRAGSATIYAAVEGFGKADTTFEVSEPPDQFHDPSQLRLWVFPPKTSNKAYGVVSLYGNSLSDSDSPLIPLPFSGLPLAVVSDDGLSHRSIIGISQSSPTSGLGRPSAIEFEIDVLKEGNYTVSVSGPGLDAGSSTISAVSPYSSSSRLDLVPLPALPGVYQDLALLSAVNSDGAVVSTTSDIHIISSIPLQRRPAPGDASTIILSGVLDGKERIVASSPNLPSSHVTVSPTGQTTTPQLEAPSIVHASEPFPFVAHLVDSHGVPIAKITEMPLSLSEGVRTVAPSLLQASYLGPKDIAVLTGRGADNTRLDVFENTMNVGISLDRLVQVGSPVRLAVMTDVSDPSVSIDSPIPFSKESARAKEVVFVANPSREGTFDVTITVSKEGFETVTRSLTFEVQQIYNLDIQAADATGDSLSVPYLVVGTNKTLEGVTPASLSLDWPFLSVQFPPTYRINNATFLLKEVQNKTGTPNHTALTALYDRMITIDVQGAIGSGLYQYGQNVTLSAPPRDVLFFLVRETFDHWEGLPYQTQPVSFVATKDLVGKAVYHYDYTFLMATISALASAFLYWVVAKPSPARILAYLRKIGF